MDARLRCRRARCGAQADAFSHSAPSNLGRRALQVPQHAPQGPTLQAAAPGGRGAAPERGNARAEGRVVVRDRVWSPRRQATLLQAGEVGLPGRSQRPARQRRLCQRRLQIISTSGPSR